MNYLLYNFYISCYCERQGELAEKVEMSIEQGKRLNQDIHDCNGKITEVLFNMEIKGLIKFVGGKYVLTIALSPLMNGKLTKSERTMKSINLADSILEETEKLKCLTLLYELNEH